MRDHISGEWCFSGDRCFVYEQASILCTTLTALGHMCRSPTLDDWAKAGLRFTSWTGHQSIAEHAQKNMLAFAPMINFESSIKPNVNFFLCGRKVKTTHARPAEYRLRPTTFHCQATMLVYGSTMWSMETIPSTGHPNVMNSHDKRSTTSLTRRSWCWPQGKGFQTVWWACRLAGEPRHRISLLSGLPAMPGASSSPPNPKRSRPWQEGVMFLGHQEVVAKHEELLLDKPCDFVCGKRCGLSKLVSF